MKSANSIIFDISLTLDWLSPIIPAQNSNHLAKFKSFECLKAFRTRLRNRILVQDRGGAEFSSVAGLPA
jgi:hypothetical protein